MARNLGVSVCVTRNAYSRSPEPEKSLGLSVAPLLPAATKAVPFIGEQTFPSQVMANLLPPQGSVITSMTGEVKQPLPTAYTRT